MQTCRFCGEIVTQNFVDLGMSPLSNSFIKPENLYAAETFLPLHAFVCSHCYLVQLEEFETPDHIFQDYAYFSSFSQSWLMHAQQYVDKMMSEYPINSTCRVVEIASNDGYLLQYFKENNVPVLGVEPARNVAQVAIDKGIATISEFFGKSLALNLTEQGKQADLLLGNNVLAHVPDINDFIAGMKILLKPSGIITMEFPHLLRLIEDVQFDTIYHEHFSYLSLTTVNRLFVVHGLKLFDVEKINTHGGSLRIYVKHSEDSTKQIYQRVQNLLDEEEEAGLNRIETYNDFSDRVKQVKRNLLELLISLKNEGKSIVGYGAPAKGNTLFNYCGIRSDFVDYTVDRSPYKQGLFLPGTHIPIHSPEMIQETKPEYVLILPWNLKEEIMGQLSYIREWDGKFIVPIPEVTVI
ncbi:SAM-dependent methyltransferase [Paenibacillus odorifer]|uniref:SAM-dependent methyltransferase n=2 Tax=Paenibacillus TaxID=44249 RepID=A0A1R0WVJ8_9BACL|nr:methyltransferase-like protein [Paenibacillus sp. FSL H8-237]OMD22461.1 SAM-dependent methyltransferase [Paenibacillus odorifer]OME44828.1 SAM-dependent methyltransferase [Paenibacillus odorifer]OME59211.1 SAM-dependent methyltransferase [Paenibacillus odorifer]